MLPMFGDAGPAGGAKRLTVNVCVSHKYLVSLFGSLEDIPLKDHRLTNTLRKDHAGKADKTLLSNALELQAVLVSHQQEYILTQACFKNTA